MPVELHERYEINEDVAGFLTNRAFLVRLLNEAVPYLEMYFGNDAEIRLEMFSDPTAPNDCELFARILTKLSANDALDLLDRFENAWWADASSRAQHLLNFALRYV